MSHSNSEDSPALAWGVVKSMELNTAAKESAVCRTFSASVSHAQQRPSSVVGNGLTRGPGGGPALLSGDFSQILRTPARKGGFLLGISLTGPKPGACEKPPRFPLGHRNLRLTF